MAASFSAPLLFNGLCRSLGRKLVDDASVAVGDDKTSCSLAGGSFLLSFQIPVVVHGNDVVAAVPHPVAGFIFGLADGCGQPA
jgi:hypothetical protein